MSTPKTRGRRVTAARLEIRMVLEHCRSASTLAAFRTSMDLIQNMGFVRLFDAAELTAMSTND